MLVRERGRDGGTQMDCGIGWGRGEGRLEGEREKIILAVCNVVLRGAKRRKWCDDVRGVTQDSAAECNSTHS